ncbi:DNA polymerase IV [Peptoniphilus raoultii]|uniref:DNA polymerase IV n=1 Tax=Peptoniphilus raoultii TaxID=1776387 RepID=UPI0008DA9056|nr:DNA polymerase IV [Peptoniphilus raoultii]
MREILHVDLDAFYASCEELDYPALKGKPLVVAGRSERSIITTANYEARKFGIHSAMPIFMAKKLCDHLIIMPMRRGRYLQKSQEVFEILSSYTDIIEKVSIDESYLDMTGKNLDLKYLKAMQNNILKKSGLNVSIGLSFNKFLAKLASDWNKPRGIKIINKEEVPEILMDLDIRKIHGIGKKSEERLRNIGINKVRDLYLLNEEFLTEFFGKLGTDLYNRIRGIDEREVTVHRERKSIGTESTFTSTDNKKIIESYIEKFAGELSENLYRKNICGYTLTIKLKDENFKIRTRSRTFDTVLFERDEILKAGLNLLREFYGGEKIRLVGLTMSNLVDLYAHQITFF